MLSHWFSNFFAMVIYRRYIGLYIYIFMSVLFFAYVSKRNLMLNSIADHKPVEIRKT